MEASPRVEFFFSPGSRYSYLAASQMALLEAETGCTVDWRPVNGGDIRKLRRRDPFEGEPVSGQYDWSYRERDARLWADYYGIRFREPRSHHFDFCLLARAATAAKRLGRAADYGWRICAAVYGTDTWPIDEKVCIALAEEIGFDADLFWATLEDPETERVLAAAAEEALRRGAFKRSPPPFKAMKPGTAAEARGAEGERNANLLCVSLNPLAAAPNAGRSSSGSSRRFAHPSRSVKNRGE
jgi:2-hydroxychromene-2-carboxylate isomerase